MSDPLGRQLRDYYDRILPLAGARPPKRPKGRSVGGLVTIGAATAVLVAAIAGVFPNLTNPDSPAATAPDTISPVSETIRSGPELLQDIDYVETVVGSPYGDFAGLSVPDQQRLTTAAGAGSADELLSISFPLAIGSNTFIHSTVLLDNDGSPVEVECVGFERDVGNRLCLEDLPSVIHIPNGAIVVMEEGLIAVTHRLGPDTVIGVEARNGVAVISPYFSPLGEIRGEFSDGTIRTLHPGDISYEDWTSSAPVACLLEHETVGGDVRSTTWSRSVYYPPVETSQTDFEILSFDLIQFSDMWIAPVLDRPRLYSENNASPIMLISIYDPEASPPGPRTVPIRSFPIGTIRLDLPESATSTEFDFKHPTTGSTLSINCSYETNPEDLPKQPPGQGLNGFQNWFQWIPNYDLDGEFFTESVPREALIPTVKGTYHGPTDSGVSWGISAEWDGQSFTVTAPEGNYGCLIIKSETLPATRLAQELQISGPDLCPTINPNSFVGILWTGGLVIEVPVEYGLVAIFDDGQAVLGSTVGGLGVLVWDPIRGIPQVYALHGDEALSLEASGG